MVAVGGGKLGPTICWGGKLGMEKLWMHWADHRPGGLPSPCRPGQHPPPWRLQHQVVVVLHVVVVVVVVVPLASMPVEIQTGQIGHWHWFDMIFSSSVTIVLLAYETSDQQPTNCLFCVLQARPQRDPAPQSSISLPFNPESFQPTLMTGQCQTNIKYQSIKRTLLTVFAGTPRADDNFVWLFFKRFYGDSGQTQQVYQMTTEFCSSWWSWHLGDMGAVLLAVAHIRILLPPDFFWKDYQIRFCSAQPQ